MPAPILRISMKLGNFLFAGKLINSAAVVPNSDCRDLLSLNARIIEYNVIILYKRKHSQLIFVG